ncbi:MAG: putative toxin-antitoxin system toxin component, PIN family [Candidatus Korobacteraceae bacterium]
MLDTNAFVSGIFFSAPPHRILMAWRDQRVTVVYSSAIYQEYQRVLAELSGNFPEINGEPFLDLVRTYGKLVHPVAASGISCRDLADIKFVDCFLQSKARCLVSGDKDLLAVQLNAGSILSPREFCDRYL